MLTTELPQPKIAILLCTHNGEAFLREQLDSFVAQTWKNWVLIVSDDNSSDDTRNILLYYQRRWAPGRLRIVSGPARGFVENFMSVTRYAEGLAAFYAWSDQDDIWHADKLERAMRWLQDIPASTPALYCGRTQLVSPENRQIGMSTLFKKSPSFANALIQNIGGGNTMVFNREACRIVAETSIDTAVVSHDWWAYIIISGCGGQVYYDPVPSVRYRQHRDNLIGENTSWGARFLRVRELFKGRLKGWSQIHIQALSKHQERLTAENVRTLELFASARQGWLPMRLLQLIRSNVYRQTSLDNVGLALAAIFRKI